jgi:hypothetical protein
MLVGLKFPASKLTGIGLLSTSHAQTWAAATSTVYEVAPPTTTPDVPVDPDLPYYSIPAIAPVFVPPPPIGVPRESKASYTYTWTA